jgi:hypothetical protein
MGSFDPTSREHPKHVTSLTHWSYKVINGPYDLNRFPLGPLGCKAVIYTAPESRGSWASHGTDAWYVGPSMDHYGCNHFFVPETQAYCVPGSAWLFPQHSQVPFIMWNEHLQEVINKLVTTLCKLPPNKRDRVITLIHKKLSVLPTNAPP